jgi:hypothetical protein
MLARGRDREGHQPMWLARPLVGPFRRHRSRRYRSKALETRQRIQANGGTFFVDLGKDSEKENFERKFKDPDGVIFDISQKGWVGTQKDR